MDNDLTSGDEFNLDIEESFDEKKSGKKKPPLKLLIIIAAVVLVVGGAVAGWLMLSPQKAEEVKEEEVVQGELEKPKEASVYFEYIVSLGHFEVKLADMGGDRSFKTLIELEVEAFEVGEEIKRRLITIESSVKSMMGSKTLAELQGVDGKIILKTEIINYLNNMLETGKVRNLYFSEFLIM